MPDEHDMSFAETHPNSILHRFFLSPGTESLRKNIQEKLNNIHKMNFTITLYHLFISNRSVRENSIEGEMGEVNNVSTTMMPS